MTERLYLNDSYLQTVHATVTACEANENGYAVVLDKTVFYPTSGGQPHDTGTIDGHAVADVRERGERVLHSVPAAFEPGARVLCAIDWARRFDHMQQHSGEHILSFAAKEMLGAANVGFHMAERHCTLDLDKPLRWEQIHALEQSANELVCKNLPVRIQYVEAERLRALSLRKRAEGLSGIIRIVYMPGGDSCTCCGTHVAQTGEVGPVLVTATEAHKGGARVSFVCGQRALKYAQKTRDVLRDLAGAYSCGMEDAPSAAQALQRELISAKNENKALQERLVRALARELGEEVTLVNGKRLIVRLADVPASLLRMLSSALCEHQNTLALLLARNGEGAQYVLCCSDGFALDMGVLSRHVNEVLDARGGGRGNLAQGSASRAGNLSESAQKLAESMKRRVEEGT